jgi:hypothetical protein
MCGEEMSLVKLCFDLLLINTDGEFYTDSIQGFLEETPILVARIPQAWLVTHVFTFFSQ